VTATNNGFQLENFMYILPLPAWFYVGIESLNLMADSVNDPKRVIPKASMMCMVYLFCSSIFVLFVACSLPPGIKATANYFNVLNKGFEIMFAIPPNVATLLSIPGIYTVFIKSHFQLLASRRHVVFF
jgi:amino acid transporter